jgi:hypothetical protein
LLRTELTALDNPVRGQQWFGIDARPRLSTEVNAGFVLAALAGEMTMTGRPGGMALWLRR